MTGDDAEKLNLELDLRAEEVAKHYTTEFVDDLLNTAGHQRHLKAGDYEGVVRELGATLYHAGFDPRPDDGDDDPIAWTFAGRRVYYELKAELDERRRVADEPVTIAGYLPVWTDAALPEDAVIMLHRDAIVPAPVADLERPWIVEHPDGVAVAEVTHE
jgi:hypothetical protein